MTKKKINQLSKEEENINGDFVEVSKNLKAGTLIEKGIPSEPTSELIILVLHLLYGGFYYKHYMPMKSNIWTLAIRKPHASIS